MKKFQKISDSKFNQIPQDQLSSITGGSAALVELTNIRDTSCGCGGTVTDATLD